MAILVWCIAYFIDIIPVWAVNHIEPIGLRTKNMTPRHFLAARCCRVCLYCWGSSHIGGQLMHYVYLP
jgi:hypothetical protein